ncbi:flavin monoamine oxidase family protein [Mycobacterium kyogaense]|uniref:flavin monoamine oxidase family protein n=1 Tax=Mycobacterium kyogaense TaxID=2212479 RepID=UPI000DABC260|nr:NAD(P)/FAD-dependent oxidoreductase [Mycobacterium kyogaense]
MTHFHAPLPATADAIVVGGGIAGLVAARDLAASGRTVQVLEARPRLGGRTEYRTFPGTTRKVELGGTWVSSRNHPLVMDEVNRYGLSLVSEAEASFRWALTGAPFTPAFPIEGDDLYELERAWVDIAMASRRIDPTVRRDVQGGLEDLDVSLAQWVSQLKLPHPVEEFIFMMASLGMGADESEWSALDAFSLLAGMGNSPYGWLAVASQKFADGTASLVDGLAATESVVIHLDTPVHKIESFVDSVEVQTSRGSMRASDVVFATPVNTWHDVDFGPTLFGAKRALAEQGHQGRMVKFWILVDDAPDGFFGLGRGTDLLCLNTQYRVPEGVIMVAFASPPSTFRPVDRTAVATALRQVLPEATLIDYVAHDWKEDPWSQGSWIGYPPGYLSASASEISAPVGRIAFANADLATTWIGWIEGALESGRAAARSIMEARA